MPFFYNLGYDSSVWYPVGSSGTQSWQPLVNWGWRGETDALVGYVNYEVWTASCRSDDNTTQYYTVYLFDRYVDEFGTSHPINGRTDTKDQANCISGGGTPQATVIAQDGSGLTFPLTNDPDASVIKSDGSRVSPPLNIGSFGGVVTDRNGNQITTNGGSFTDTLGMTALTISGNAPNPKTFTYTDSNGTQQSVTINYSAYTVQTNFGCSGISEYGPAATSLASSISYPDGSSYSFTYEATPGAPGNVTGRVASITLRTGGTIDYAYTGGNQGIVCADGSTAGFSRTTTDGPTTYTRSGSGTAWTTTVTDAQANQTVINFQTASGNFYETHRTLYQGSASANPPTILGQTDTCYNGSVPACSGTAITLPLTEIKKYAMLNNNQQSLTDTFLNSVGLPTQVNEYDFGASAPGALLRQNVISYANLGNGIVDLPASVIVQDGAGNQKAKTTLGYDETTPAATSGIPQHAGVSGSRGNLTSINRWLDATNSNLATALTYDDTGNLLTNTDPGGHQAQFSYADNFADGINRNSLAYVTQVTMPDTNSPTLAHHVTKAQYDANTGLAVKTWDQNNQVMTATYDMLLRPLQTNFPDGGNTTFIYWNPNQTDVQQKMTSSTGTYSATLLDSYGRLSRVARENGETNPWDQQDFCYDSMGRLSFQSYPYQGGGWATPKVCSGAGESVTYDAIGRMTQVTHSDATYAQKSYNGRAYQITDEGNGSARVSRIMQSDGLGRMTSVCEVSATTQVGSSNVPGPCGLDISGTGFLTTYSYDTLNNLTAVAQGSLTARTYTYDSLSRMTSEREPEWGSTTDTRIQSSGGNSNWKYGVNGACPSVNGTVYSISVWVKNQGTTSVRIGGNIVDGPIIAPGTAQQVSFTETGDGFQCSQLGFETVNVGDVIDVLAYNPVISAGGVNLIPAADQNFSTGWYTWNGSSVTVTQIGGGAAQTAYSYNNDSLLTQRVRPKVNQTDPTVTTSTNYVYDSLHRLTQRWYSDTTTPNAYFNYDESAPLGISVANSVGLLTSEYNNAGPESIYSYDAMGRVTSNWQCPLTSGCSSTGNYTQFPYSYDLMGNLATSWAGSATFTYGYNIAARPTSVSSSLVDANHPANLLASAHYNAFGAVTSAFYGTNASNTGIGETRTYDVRGRNLYQWTNVNGGPGLEAYSNVTYAPNGNMLSVNDAINYGNWTYAYDDLNRLKSASYVGGAGGSYTYDYDRYGNRWHQNGGTQLWNQAFDANNHILGWSYDAAGNLLSDGSHNYTYDAEGRMLTVDGGAPAGTTYTYDAEQRRATRTTGTGARATHYFLYDLAGRVAMEFDPQYVDRDEIYAGARHVATYSAGLTFFNLVDWLGNERVKSTQDESGEQSFANLPFGDGQALWGLTVGQAGPIQFTGDEHDSESNLEHTWFRQYSSAQGRWLTPDPYSGSMDPANPQSLNRYAYVMNDPINNTDSSGLVCDDDCVWDHLAGAFGGWGGNCTMNGIGAPCGLVQGFLGNGWAVDCAINLCGPTPVSGPKGNYIGFAVPSYGLDDSISYSFTFDPGQWLAKNGIPLTAAALIERLGLPTQVGGAFQPVSTEEIGQIPSANPNKLIDTTCVGEPLSPAPLKGPGRSVTGCEMSYQCQADRKAVFIGGADYSAILQKCGTLFANSCPYLQVQGKIAVFTVAFGLIEVHAFAGGTIDKCSKTPIPLPWR